MREYGEESRIVAGVCGSPSSLSALCWAIRQAELTGGAVDAVIAWHNPVSGGGYEWAPAQMPRACDFQEVAEKTLADAIGKAVGPGGDVRVRARVVEGSPGKVLLDAAADADLLVVGSRGRSGFLEALLGSVSQHCVHHASCPVVVVCGLRRA